MQIALKFAERQAVSLSVLFKSLDRIVPLESIYEDHQIQLPSHFRDKQNLKLIVGA